jgi:O-antigen ligase
MRILNLGDGKSFWAFLLATFIGLYLLFSIISISVSQIFISLALICWIIILIRKEQKFSFPSFFWPIIAYVILSLVSSFFSINPKASFKDDRELLLFLIIPIVYTGFHEEKALERANLALLASTYISCLYSIYYFFFKAPWRWYRAKNIMGFVMTRGGLLMLFSCVALSVILFSKGKIKYLWGLGFILSFFALIQTQTRSAWLGFVVALCFMLLVYKPITLIIVPIMIGLFYIASPQLIKNRALSIFNPKDPINMSRIELWRAGIKIIRDYPIFGTGPNTVKIVYQNPKYELSEAVKKEVHLHNNILQTAAERGIPTLLAWLTFMVLAFINLLKLLKNKEPTHRTLTVAALAAILGLNVAGMFEYNFADAEITMLFLYIITIPFSLARILKKTEPQPA